MLFCFCMRCDRARKDWEMRAEEDWHCDRRYSTGSNINTYSALIQNFYSQETAPHQAVHLSLNTGVEAGKQAGVRAFIRCVSVPQTARSAQAE